MRVFIGFVLSLIAFQVLAGSEAGTAVFMSREDGNSTTTQFEYLNESTSRMNVETDSGSVESYVLFTEGKALVVNNTQDQTIVMDMAEISNMAKGFGSSTGQQTQGFTSSISSMEPTGKSETVAGIEGEVYTLKWNENGTERIDELVLTSNKKAIGYTRAWMSAVRAIQKSGVDKEVKGDQLTARLEKENLGILRLGNRFELKSIDNDQPVATRFEVPASTMQMSNMGSLFGGGQSGQINATASEPAENAQTESGGGLWGGIKDKFKQKSDRQANRQQSRAEGAADRATDRAVDEVVGESVNKIFGKIFK